MEDSDSLAQAARLLVEVVPSLQRSFRTLVGRHLRTGVSVGQYRLLARMAGGGPWTLGDLAEREGVAPPTLCRTIDALERRGLVLRSPDPIDRRRTYLTVSEGGLVQIQEVRDHLGDLVRKALATWSEGEHDQLVGVLERLLPLADSLLSAEAPSKKVGFS